MIQLVRPESGGSHQLKIVKLNLKDKLSSDFDTDNGLLVSLKSQLTKKEVLFTPVANWGAAFYNERITTFFIYVSADGSNVNSGIIQMGTKDYPLGFYDVIIYQNSDPTNFDPSSLSVVYMGLANVSATTNAQSPTYTEYTTNDSDTENVYITLN